MRIWLSRMIVLIAMTGVAGCAATPAPPAKQTPAVIDLSGVWTGTLHVTPCDMLASNGRCHAVNDITFVLNQDGSAVTGKYSCAAASTTCRHGGADDAGIVEAGSVSGNQLNLSVVIPADTSKCFYNADAASSGEANGVYVCFQHGFPVEQGVWSATRQPAAGSEPLADSGQVVKAADDR